MSFFKKLFGSADEKAETKRSSNVDRSALEIKAAQIRPGHLIVCKPYGSSHAFEKAVILVVQTKEDAVMGLNLSQPTNLTLEKGVKKAEGCNARIYKGGPVLTEKLLTLHKLGSVINGSAKVTSGVFFCPNFPDFAVSAKLKGDLLNTAKFFAGLTSWTIEQLQGEMDSGSWSIHNSHGLAVLGPTDQKIWYYFYPEFESVYDMKILPRITVNYNHSMYNEDKKSETLENVPENQLPIATELTPDLNLCFVEDTGSTFIYLKREFQSRHPVLDIEMLLKMSEFKLRGELGQDIKIEQFEDGLLMIMAGGNHEASIILIDGFMDHIIDQLQGDIHFAIPARDLLFICKADNEMANENMKRRVQYFFEKGDTQGLLSKGIYKRQLGNKKFELLGTAF